MTVMIIPNETLLTTSADTVPGNGPLILKGMEKGEDAIFASIHTDATFTESSCFDLDFSSHEFPSEHSQGPIVTPKPRPCLKRIESVSNCKNVCFDTVTIRSYSQTMGDNPAVSYGPPISLDWDYEQHDDIDIDEYESGRGFSRRTMRQMVISYYRRKAMLSRDYGFSEEELVKAKKAADRTKFKREITNMLLPAMHVEAAIESARRKAKRIIRKSN